jgi:hypothetical protein
MPAWPKYIKQKKAPTGWLVLKERYMKKKFGLYFAVIREEDPSNVGAKYSQTYSVFN